MRANDIQRMRASAATLAALRRAAGRSKIIVTCGRNVIGALCAPPDGALGNRLFEAPLSENALRSICGRSRQESHSGTSALLQMTTERQTSHASLNVKISDARIRVCPSKNHSADRVRRRDPSDFP